MSDIIINEDFVDDGGLFDDDFDSGGYESLESFELRMQAQELSNETEINEIISWPKIKKNLEFDFPYQREGALKLLRDMNGSGLLADEVGLGKTITGGITLKECVERGFVKKALILTPPSLVDQWVAELKEKFELDFTIIEDETTWDKASLAIASIDRVKIYDHKKNKFRHSKAHEISWDLLIVDEAHKLKDKNTTRWKFVDQIQKKRFLVLTATPFQNDLLELYNLLHILKKGHLGTMKEFREQFLHKGSKRYPLNPRELKRKLDEVMLRRRRMEVGINYKKRIPKIVPVDLTPEEKSVYQRSTDLLKTKYFKAGGREITGRLIVYAILPKMTSSSRAAIESLSRIVNDESYHEETRKLAYEILQDYKALKKDSKVEKLVEIVKEILDKDPNDKILIYTKHPTTLNYIVEKLAPFNLKIVPFIGGVPREERTEIINQFKKDAQILISTETGAEGLNFQFCSNLINYDLPWNPMSVEQRIGRLDRIGQKKDMHIYSLATKGTMEEHVVDLIVNKMCCIGLVIGELPIILFNLGLDGKGRGGTHKIEEMLMNSFLDAKDNLEVFSQDVEKIADMIEDGIKQYQQAKDRTAEVLDAQKKEKAKNAIS